MQFAAGSPNAASRSKLAAPPWMIQQQPVATSVSARGSSRRLRGNAPSTADSVTWQGESGLPAVGPTGSAGAVQGLCPGPAPDFAGAERAAAWGPLRGHFLGRRGPRPDLQEAILRPPRRPPTTLARPPDQDTTCLPGPLHLQTHTPWFPMRPGAPHRHSPRCSRRSLPPRLVSSRASSVDVSAPSARRPHNDYKKALN